MKRLLPLAQLFPLVLPVLIFFGAGLALTFKQALSGSAGGSVERYKEILGDPVFRRNALYSLKIAGASTAGAIVPGTLLAYGIWRLPVKQQRWTAVYRIPLILPHITVAFLVLFLFSGRGWFPALIHTMGLKPGDSFGGGSGLPIILAYIYKEVPFVILMVLGVLRTIPEDMIITAKQLGAGELRTFARVVLPYLRRVLHILSMILFLYTFGAFDIPFLLGRSRPSMLSIDIYRMYFERDLSYRPLVMARLTLMLAFSLILLMVSRYAGRRFKKKGGSR